MILSEVLKQLCRSESLNEPIEGTYRVIRVKWHDNPRLGACRCLELQDCSGTAHALLPGEARRPWLAAGAPYSLNLRARTDQERPVIEVVSISDTPVSDFNPLVLLPSEWTPIPDVIPRLLCLYQQLNSPALVRFWEMVFRNESWVRGFFSIPASKACHHSELGGLLAHSVEVAESVAATVRMHPLLSDIERDAATTVALLHDATKVVWSSHNPNRWKVPFRPREHERLLPYFLAEPLLDLMQHDQDAHGVLVRLIDDYTRPHEFSNSPLNSIIRDADRLSSHLDARDRERMSKRNKRNWIKAGGRMHWCPLTPHD